MKNLSVIIILAISLISCQKKNSSTEHAKDYSIHNGTIALQENATLWNRIKLDTLKATEGQSSWRSVGTVRIIPGNNATISSPFSGRIINSYVQIGQKVGKGTPLFSLHSSDFYAAQKDLLDSKIELKQAKIQLERQQDLVKKGVGTQRELEEAQALYAIASSAYDNNKAFLRIFGANPEQSTIGNALTIYAPIAGEVISNKIAIGQYLKEDDEPILQIAQLGQVWIEAQVKEKDFNILNQIKNAIITTDAYPDQKIEGRIKHINEIVDEDTRSIQILIEANNDSKRLKPGMFVNIELQGVNQQQLMIEKTAIMQDMDSQFVFVENEDKSFKKVKVKTQNSNNELQSVVLEGLNEGAIYIREGAIYINNLK